MRLHAKSGLDRLLMTFSHEHGTRNARYPCLNFINGRPNFTKSAIFIMNLIPYHIAMIEHSEIEYDAII